MATAAGSTRRGQQQPLQAAHCGGGDGSSSALLWAMCGSGCGGRGGVGTSLLLVCASVCE